MFLWSIWLTFCIQLFIIHHSIQLRAPVNYCGAETGMFKGNEVNTMAVDALVMQGARPSAAIVLTM